MLPSLTDSRSNSSFQLKESAIMMYRRGDSGHPWRSPHEDLNNPVDQPFKRGEIHDCPMQALIQQMKI